MANLIDATYFVGELNIPNTDQIAVSENLNLFIAKYEGKFLKLIMGAGLYAEYIAGISEYPVDQKWIDLQNALVDTNTKVSPIANYIYFYFVRDKTTYNSGVGVVKAKTDNAGDTDGKIKTTRAWNEMCELCYGVYKFIYDNQSIYGQLPYQPYFNFYQWLDWSSWWYGYGYRYFRYVPEIYSPVNSLNI